MCNMFLSGVNSLFVSLQCWDLILVGYLIVYKIILEAFCFFKSPGTRIKVCLLEAYLQQACSQEISVAGYVQFNMEISRDVGETG